ncbi:MAG: asparagine synthase-related protein [Chitinophagales bacterium]
MIELKLTYNAVYKWQTIENISAIGYAFLDNVLLNTDELITYFNDIKTENDFTEKLQKISGHFSVIIKLENVILVAVDTIRTFPVFIQKNEQTILITDRPSDSGILNKNAVNDFEKIYCTSENETLLINCLQLQAGEYAIVNKSTYEIAIHSYFKHSANANQAANIDSLKLLENDLIQKIKTVSANKTILLPLSGGYDSRYLLALLKENNITNVQCFTYGKKDSYEVLIAKNVAEKLNYKWYFIEYTDELLMTFFSAIWANYSDNNHHYTSLPHEQDFFALHYLKTNNLLPENVIVINGFCQDIMAGSFLEPIKRFDLKSYILEKYEMPLRSNNYENSWNGYQEWLVKNRLSKFIINSVHVYTYFGLEFYLPFWNTNWITFWYNIQLKMRMNQQFYNDYLFNGIFKIYNIAYKKPNHDATNYLYDVKKLAKSILPKKITETIRQFNAENEKTDANNSLFLYQKIFENLKNKPAKKDLKINNIHALYFLENLKEKQQF